MRYFRLLKNSSAVLLGIAFWLQTPLIADQQTRIIEKIELNVQQTPSPKPYLTPFFDVRKPMLGLALSGGGLRGITQIGVLKVLDENGIQINRLVGTSIGAVIGGLYASGYRPDEIWEITKAIDWGRILVDAPQRSALFLGEKQKRNRALLQFRLQGLKPSVPEALTPGQNLLDILTNLTLNAPFHSLDFTQFPTALRILTTDLLTGDKVLLEKGDLAEAMRASIAIPLLFTPVSHENKLLVDGGIINNIPVLETRDFGADHVIAVNATSPLRSGEDMTAPWEIADQVTTIMQQTNNRAQLAAADVVIDFSDVPSTSTNSAMIDSLYQLSQERTREKLPDIRRLLNPSFSAEKGEQSYVIDRIEFVPDIPVLKNYPVSTHSVTRAGIVGDLVRIYSHGGYENLFAQIVSRRDSVILQYHLTAAPILRQVHFSGVTAFADSILEQHFVPLLDQSVNYHQTRLVFEQILKMYRDEGYSLATISDVTFDSEKGAAVIHIAEGIIDRVEFVGQKRTRHYVLSREFSVKENELFFLERVKNGLQNIYATDLFRSVTLQMIPNGEKTHLRVALEEKSPTTLRWGARFDSERRGRSFLELADENVFGSGNDLTLHGQFGARDLATSVEYRADQLFKTFLTAQVSAYYNRHKYYSYENLARIGEYERRATGVSLSIGTQIERFGTLSGIIRFEEINLWGLPGKSSNLGALVINKVGLHSEVDSRDQVPFALSGKHHRFSYLVSSGKFLGADISYFKIENQLTNYYSFWKRNTITTLLQWGTSDMTTPFSEQFRVGGEHSFFGLLEGELQGRHMMIGSLGYRYRFPWKSPFEMYGLARWDIGYVWRAVVDIKGEDMITGRGVSFAIKTPLGPISFSYGRSSLGKGRFYFSAGYDF